MKEQFERAGQTRSGTRRWRQAVIAVVTAAALGVTGMVAAGPAYAADPTTITGTIRLPAGFSSGTLTAEVGVIAFSGGVQEGSSSSITGADFGSDGTAGFSITGLTAGDSYDLFFVGDRATLASGYVAPNGTLTELDSAAAVSSGATGIVVSPVAAVSISGTVAFPPGYDASAASSFGVIAFQGSWSFLFPAAPSYFIATVAADGTFTVTGLAPGIAYTLAYYDGTAQLKSIAEYYVDDASALTTNVKKAADVSAPASGLYLRPVNKTGAFTAPTPFGSAPDPAISGTVAVGSAVVAVPGGWVPGDAALHYQWALGGTPVSGANGQTYTPVAADAGKSLTVAVTATKAGYATTTKTSAAVTVKKGAIVKAATPKVSGKAVVGAKLKAKAGSWDKGVALSYRWYRNGKAIKGATKAGYTIAKADKGKTLRVKVTGTKSGYATVTKSSKSTKKVATKKK